MTSRPLALGGVVAVVTLGLSACGGGGSDPMATSSASGSGSAAAGSVVVGSANFPESELLMNIYAGALKAKGVDATTKPNIGSREAYLPALEKGEINVIPEYTGMLNLNYDAKSTAKTSDEVYAALKKNLPSSLTVLAKSAAEDKDALVVTKETADKYKLTSISDLAPVAGQLVLGGPPEWPKRPSGPSGLKATYGLTFKEFKPLDAGGPLTVQALKGGQAQVVDLFTTDPQVAANGFVVLEDPKSHFAAQNVVPVVTKASANDKVTAALDGVSAKLDTPTLAGLVKKVVIDHEDADSVANDWLKSVSLG